MNIFGINFQWIEGERIITTKGKILKKRGPFKRLRIGEATQFYYFLWNVLLAGPLVVNILLLSLFSEKDFDLIWLGVPVAQFYLGPIYHELMHAIPLWRIRERITILLFRKAVVIGGQLSVKGEIEYAAFQRSLWAPMLPGFVLVLFFFLSIGWGNPWLTQFFLFSGLIVVGGGGVDAYWSWVIHKYGPQAKYFDHGRYLDIVWKEQE